MQSYKSKGCVSTLFAGLNHEFSQFSLVELQPTGCGPSSFTTMSVVQFTFSVNAVGILLDGKFVLVLSIVISVTSPFTGGRRGHYSDSDQLKKVSRDSPKFPEDSDLICIFSTMLCEAWPHAAVLPHCTNSF